MPDGIDNLWGFLAILFAGGLGAFIMQVGKVLSMRAKGKRGDLVKLSQENRLTIRQEFDMLKEVLKHQQTQIENGEKNHMECLKENAEMREEIGRLKEAVRRLEESIRKITAVVIADEAGIITQWNPGAHTLFHWTAEEMIGQPITKMIPRRYLQRHSRAIKARIRSGEDLEDRLAQFEALTRENTEIPVNVTYSGWRKDNKWEFCATFTKQ